MPIQVERENLKNDILSALCSINYDNGGPDLQAKATEIIAEKVAIYVDKAIQELTQKIETTFNSHVHSHPAAPTGAPLKSIKF